jgi:tripartite-type tricarboxylate transporter receptor subunit TctC
VERLHRETVQALQTPSLRDRLAKLDVEPMPMTPAEFGAFLQKDIAVQGALAKAAGLKVN